MYKLVKNPETDAIVSINRTLDNYFIPLNLDNRDYQRFLDEINEQGINIIDSELPESVMQEAAGRKFNKQLTVYKQAVHRLSQYVLSQGRPEIKKMLPSPTGDKVFNKETQEYEDVLVEVVTQSAVDALPATIEIWEGDDKATVRNPVIVQDEAERAAAQAVIDATPQEVKDAAK